MLALQAADSVGRDAALLAVLVTPGDPAPRDRTVLPVALMRPDAAGRHAGAAAPVGGIHHGAVPSARDVPMCSHNSTVGAGGVGQNTVARAVVYNRLAAARDDDVTRAVGNGRLCQDRPGQRQAQSKSRRREGRSFPKHDGMLLS